MGGVEVHGNRNEDQLPFGNPTHQGMAKFENEAILEQARFGVRSHNPNNWQEHGGVIIAENSTFKNCMKAIEFSSYEYTPSSGFIQPNSSIFKKCNFILDKDLPDGEDFDAFVTLWKVNGIRFLGCNFEVDDDFFNLPFLRPVNFGIVAIDARFAVVGLCTSGTNCDIVNGDFKYSTFKNLPYGIRVANPTSNKNNIVRMTKFENCYKAIHSSKVNNSIYANNNIQLPRGDFSQFDYFQHNFNRSLPMGITSINSSGYRIENNLLKSYDEGIQMAQPAHGVIIDNAGERNALVYKNTFSEILNSIYFTGENRHYIPKSRSTGSRFLCNDFDEFNNGNYPQQTVYVFPGDEFGSEKKHSIHYHQLNEPNYATGNLHPSPTRPYVLAVGSPTNSTLPYAFEYHYDDLIPVTSSGFPSSIVNFIEAQTPFCPNTIFYTSKPEDHLPLFDIIVKEDGINILEDDIGIAIASLEANLNGGNTNALIAAINSASDMEVLKDDLEQYTPYLTDEALLAAAYAGMPNELLIELCLQNPDFTQSEDFISELENDIPNPITAQMGEDIRASWENTTSYTQEFADLAQLQFELETNLRLVINYYLEHENGSDIRKVISLTKKMPNDISTLYEVVDLHLGLNEYDSANIVMNSITSNFTLNQKELDHHNAFQDFIDVLETMHIAGDNFANLPHASHEQLYAISQLDDITVSHRAKEILNFFVDTFEYHYQLEIDTNMSSSHMVVNRKTNQVSTQKSSVYPNPTKGNINITVNDDCNNCSLILYNNVGKVVKQAQLNSGENTLNLKRLPAGVYIYHITSRDHVSEYGKLILK